VTGLLLTGGRVITGAEDISDGWLLIDQGVVVASGDREAPVPATAGEPGVVDLHGRIVVPGFIDLHVHGGGGATFDDGAAGIDAGLAAHRAHGTTRSLVSLVTAPMTAMRQTVAAASAAVAGRSDVLGLHLEGPFLSVERRGVHNPDALVDPASALVDGLLEAGGGRVRVVTVAPERDGGLAAVGRLVGAGVHAAVGHSDAGYDVARAAFDAGADLVTHAFNGMRPLHHRDPAIIGAALDAGDVVLEVINDGVHLHEATVRLLRRASPGRLALITDAMAGAAAPDGLYALAGYPVRVQDGEARLVDGGAIAGSTLTMDVAVRRAVDAVGMSLLDACRAASMVPATLLGVGDRYGSLLPGRAADLVVLDDALGLCAVLADGRWVDDRRP
jgi:N-acetylglucosamine-6-phosphate deacetylase